MTRNTPSRTCHDLAFRAGYAIDDPAEVALEDYARVLTRAESAEAMRSAADPSRVEGVHVCGFQALPTPQLLTDLEDFARDLAHHAGGGGLGWS